MTGSAGACLLGVAGKSTSVRTHRHPQTRRQRSYITSSQCKFGMLGTDCIGHKQAGVVVERCGPFLAGELNASVVSFKHAPGLITFFTLRLYR